jgi:membrane associated rhomboid family serine protease
MIIPLRTDSRLHRTPYMNWALIALNILIYLLEAPMPWLTTRFQLNPRDPHLDTFITYAFLHGNLLHIAGNMLFLYIFGNNVNDKMGNLGYLAYYLAGAVFAGIVYVIVPDQVHPVIGASGAIAAVTGAYLVLFPRSNVTILFFFFFVGTYEIASLYFVLFFFAYDLYANFSQSDGVAHVAHIGGTLFGFTLCLIMLFARLLPRDQFDVVALFQRWNKRRQYRDVVASGYNPFDYTRTPATPKAPTMAPPDPQTARIADLRSQINQAVADRDLERATQHYLELHKLDPGQVLARQTQLDIANHLAAAQDFPTAAAAYELFLTAYPKYEQVEQVELMLGLIYTRYLARFDRARELLKRALTRLHNEREAQLARAELAHIDAAAPPPFPPATGGATV